MKRVEMVIAALRPNLVIVWDPEPPPGMIRFRVETTLGKVRVIESSGHIGLDEIGGWSDGELASRLHSLGGGRL